MLHNFLRKVDGDPSICVRRLAGRYECGRTKAEHIRPWRESVVTGQRELESSFAFGGCESVLLYDGAEAVPVLDECASLSTWLDAEGVAWVRHVWCGPAAPLPRAYRESVEPGPIESIKAYVFEERDAQLRYTWRQVADARVPEAVAWAVLRREYEAREDRP
jgi:hypothetical protein